MRQEQARQGSAREIGRRVVLLAMVGLLCSAGLVGRSVGAAPARSKTYVVRSGDNLSLIAHRNGLALSDLRSANPALRSDVIVVGQTLRVPLLDDPNRLPRAITRNPTRLRLRPVIQYWAKRNAIPADLVEATLYLESGWNPSAVSSVGAIGVGQLMPETTAFIKHSLIGQRAGGPTLRASVPHENIRMSARYLRFLLRQHRGDSTKALQSYYQGTGSIRQNGLYEDTVAYARNVQALRSRFRTDRSGS